MNIYMVENINDIIFINVPTYKIVSITKCGGINVHCPYK